MGAPDLRILQANERTFLAWARTGIALVIFGFALARIAVWLEPLHPPAGSAVVPPSDDTPLVVIGVLLVVCGALVPGLAVIRHARIRAAIIADQPTLPSALPSFLLAGLLAGVGLALALWLTLA